MKSGAHLALRRLRARIADGAHDSVLGAQRFALDHDRRRILRMRARARAEARARKGQICENDSRGMKPGARTKHQSKQSAIVAPRGLLAFVRAAPGLARARISPLAGDASFRAYWRARANGETWIAMSAPPARENLRAFVDARRRIAAAELPAPEILAVDYERGFLLESDLGDDDYARAVARGEDPEPLYRAAVDALAQMQLRAPAAGLPAYDEAALRAETDLFPNGIARGGCEIR